MPLIERCVCDGRIFRVVEAFGLPMRECRSCFSLHQHVEMSADELARWYAERYHADIYTHSYDHDLDVARKRIARYGKSLIGPVLDIGCGNGAFVDACREEGIEAEGQDIGGAAARHRQPVETLSVPHRFATITMHDVLEHCIDPVLTLRAVRNLLNPDGVLILDFPAFFEPEGYHHWKRIEHLWMLSERQLERLLIEARFHVNDSYRPVAGKITFRCSHHRRSVAAA